MGAQAALVLPRKSDSIQPSSKPLVAMAKAMKAMKVMKKKAAMKAMKAMKEKTVGGLTAKDLIKNKYGKVVSKKSSSRAKKSPWIQAIAKARKALRITGFVAVKKGSPVYVKAKEFYNN